jgi:hypothetical protein
VTASLPAEVQAVFDQFATAELTTIDGLGQPITWPVSLSYTPGAPCIDVPHKDAPSNPLVALLFSDPAGSGLDDPPMVLVQGSAQVDDPAHFSVRPERVYVWAHGDVGRDPELYGADMEEVRSGHSEQPERYHAAPHGGASTWDARIAELGTRYPSAVLSLVAPDGFPFALRAPVQADDAARVVRIGGAPVAVPFQPGLACLTPRQDFQLRGDLVFADGGWVLIPHDVC